jgi:hypothetical protein
MNIYKEAVKNSKVRFNLGNGYVTVVDLWHYSLERLDALYTELYSELEATNKASLLKPKTDTSKLLELKLEVVKDIVETKLAEKEAKELRAFNEAKANIIREKLAAKKDQALDTLSEEELLKQLADLEI